MTGRPVTHRTQLSAHAFLVLVLCGLAAACPAGLWAAEKASGEPETVASIAERFAAAARAGEEQPTPDFQKHVVPMLGRLGCNGRACHGAFQGQGGFQLSLFGYDFTKDHDGLMERIDVDDPAESYALQKALGEDDHGGGPRFERDSWEYRAFKAWVSGGAPGVETPAVLTELVVEPSEIVFRGDGRPVDLRVVARWDDGTSEDVTALTRFTTNDDQVAAVTETGRVSSVGRGDTHVVAFYDNGIVPVPVLRPISEELAARYPAVETPTEIDRLVVDKLCKLGELPSDLADDATFLRRVSLDVTGTLPTVEEVRTFLASAEPDKRARKVEELLASPAYAAYWANWLCDVTGNSTDHFNNVSLNAQTVARQWYSWMEARVAENRPYDEIVRGLMLSQSRRPGESFADYSARSSEQVRTQDMSEEPTMPWFWARSNFRQPQERAVGVAYAFLGVRIQCAECHKHPFDIWTQDDFTDFQQFFTTTRYAVNTDVEARDAMLKELGVSTDLRGNALRKELRPLIQAGKTVPMPEVITSKAGVTRKPKNFKKLNKKQRDRILARLRTKDARVLGGGQIDLQTYEDPREPVYEWMTGPAQDLFARAFVNRVWARYFGRGIVEPPDDLSLANPPSNGPLLEHLTQEFIDSGYDMKMLHRMITGSRTYQTDWRPTETNAGDRRNFARALIRRMPAEAAMDAMALASTAGGEDRLDDLANRMIANPIRGAKISERQYALGIFGASIRETNCDCDRSDEASLLQTVYLRNDRDVLNSIANSPKSWLGEVSRRWGFPVGNDRIAKRPANYREQMQRFEQQIKRLRKAGRKPQLAKTIANRNKYIKRFGPEADDPAARRVSRADVKPPGLRDFRDVVTEAYLRTVSREPTEQERDIAVNAIREAEHPVDGLRDVLWALVNTKEFIVNK